MKDWRARMIDALFTGVAKSLATALMYALSHSSTVGYPEPFLLS